MHVYIKQAPLSLAEVCCFPRGATRSQVPFRGTARWRKSLGKWALKELPRESLDRVSEPGRNNYTPSCITKGDTHSVTLEEDLALKLLTDGGTSEVLEK